MSIQTNNTDNADDGYIISTDPALVDIGKAYDFLINESYWAAGLQLERFERAVKNSMCFSVCKDGEFAGLARVITDKASFAYICDVFILKEHRGKGLGKRLMDAVVNHPELDGLRRWLLATLDAHGLYEQFGFSALENIDRWMQKYKPYTT
ncbi:GNAT family N-acetyltransferase [Mucilaginibacter sp. RS28]|uniref:GNAT family N-acetyltransferase n=1 Tax=Mucilaginibacter straminoryzae TaxID=2932774 RepID=A0A9X1X1U3_9SPHI|nr:GNAT family N-acetyltransferase [Mucilaginibacter straminoryzae]MCJ8209677.1 GNAT family N-acetyltransferase [Mucilaginibacter straminoryzae]